MTTAKSLARGVGPPHRTAGPPLPVQPTPLIGRDAELADLRAQILDQGTRLVTVTGPGGSGKTRLAVAVTEAESASFLHGAAFVDLSPLRDASLVTAAIADALGVQDVGARPLLEAVIAMLLNRELLLVLDNFEHVLAAAPTVAALLEACPQVRVLATSREPLHLRWEHRFPLAPLALPSAQDDASPERLSAVPSCRLFVDRARAVRPDFRLSAHNAPVVGEICRRLDGLPLAVELAAARSGLLAPSALLARLSHSLDLRASEVDRPERHRTLRDAISWSHDLLGADEQRIFRRLAVFAGDATLTAAATVCAADEREAEMLDRLESLSEKGLLQARDSANPEPRFGMLETIREYAWERLETSGELVDTRRRHASFYASLVAQGEAAWWGPDLVVWADRFETELGNLRAALAWSLDPQADIRTGLEIVGRQPYFWDLRGHIGEARESLARLLAARGANVPSIERARAQTTAAYLALIAGDHVAALVGVQEALPLARALGDAGTQWYALVVLGHTFRHVDPGAAEPFFREAEAIARAGDYPAGLDASPFILGFILGFGFILGEFRRAAGDLAGARALFEECLGIARARQIAFTAAFAQRGLGHLDWMEGEYARAEALLEEALRLHATMRFGRGIADAMEALAWNAASWGRAERAATLLGAAEGMREALGLGVQGGHLGEHQQSVDAARARLGSIAFDAAFAAGRAWSAEQAVNWALNTDAASTHGGAKSSGPLTAREREVARLLAQDYTNRQIAEALVIAERTAETHVTNILTKLNLVSRVQVAAWAIAHGLVSADIEN